MITMMKHRVKPLKGIGLNVYNLGDRIDSDIVPANLMGMRMVWVKQGFGQYWNVRQELDSVC